MPRLRAVAILVLLLLCTGFALAQGARPPPAAPARHDADKVRNALMALLPPRLVLGEVSVEDDRVRVSGTAPQQAQVSDFLRAIDRAGDFQRADLRNVTRNGTYYSFEIGLQVACAHGVAKSGPRPCNPPPGKSNTVHKCRVNGTLTFQATPCAPGQEG
jgi:hypothetical protein